MRLRSSIHQGLLAAILGATLYLGGQGCGDTAASIPDLAPIDLYGRSLAEAVCAHSAGCCKSEPSVMADAQTCAQLEDNAAADVETIRRELVLGHVLFHEDRAEACHVAITKGLSCVQSLDTLLPRGLASTGLGECAGVFEGLLRTGVPCTSDVACAGDAECVARTDEERRCRPLPGAGDACAGGRCQAGLACLEGECTARRRKDGEACAHHDECSSFFCEGTAHFACSSPVGVGNPCQHDTDCIQLPAKKSFCSSENGKCTSALAAGAPCDRGSVCQSGYCDSANQCAPLLASGAPCYSNTVCESAVCSLKHRCLWPNETAPVGASCVPGECVKSAFCYPGTHMCDLKRGLTAACSFDDECVSHRCGTTTHTCIAALGPGAKCTADIDCQSGSCDVGTCSKLHSPGNPCTVDSNCALGLVCDILGFAEEKHVCLKPSSRSEGNPCTKATTCTSGACDVDGHFCLYRPENAECNKDSECTSGLYCSVPGGAPSGTVTGKCAPKINEGKSCESDVSCKSGLCPSGHCVAPLADGKPCQVEAPLACEHAVCASEPLDGPTCKPHPQCYL